MEENKIYSAAGLWKDFDAESLELDLAVADEKITDSGLVRKWVYFNGRQVEGCSVTRVLALIVYRKDKTKLPALVLVPPSGKPINESDADYWANKGYAVIAVDNAGESDANRHTIYPESINYANFIYSGRRLTHCDTNAKETCWYEWAVNTRRAITCISREKVADAESIGLLSMQDGAIIACMAGAFDKRLSACAVLFGSCWIKTESENDSAVDPEERDRWLAGIAPQSYLMFMKTPFYICTGTNSEETDIEKTYKTLLSIPEDVPKAMLFAPGMIDDGDEEFFINLSKWFNFFVKNRGENPEFPETELEVSDKMLFANVTVKNGGNVKDVKIVFARETGNKSARYWKVKDAEALGDNKFRTQIEISDSPGAVYCFCNVTFKGGFKISSNLAVIKASQFFNQEIAFAPASKLVFKGSSGEMPFVSYDPESCNDKIFLKEHPITLKTGPFDIKGVAGTAISTFALNDTKLIKEENSALTLDIYSESAQTLKVCYIKGFGTAAQAVFNARVELLGGDMWQKVYIDPADFHSETERPPESWNECQVLSFISEKEIVLNNLLFT